ncbi:hypothetical protein SISNIDRAFT_415363 [Sistotremastrum niveocremeum HHB9708]|uniref:Sensitive to high expression protein 9, mitochondrial n=1 Tax=Sistotremastrum niveocremeum HHB9708 TaxID=1314777 RepID=A0A164RG39_9AGAM|nr:hypothetical protein SISNIDRAFT_415363 [Sistotremastrum niveocremeum HHB9708]
MLRSRSIPTSFRHKQCSRASALRRSLSTSSEKSEETRPSSSSSPRNQIPDSPRPLAGIDRLQQRWASLYETGQHSLRVRFNGLATSAATNFALLGGKLNSVTGYEEIEALKARVAENEKNIEATRQQARDAKAAYELAVARRSDSQKEVNDLLQRKSTWQDGDVSRFTNLVREDHLREQEEVRAKAMVAASEEAVEQAFTQLMGSILNRYHEEQIWSDKIRSASTYGSLAALVMNLLVFILAIIVVEPWKRRRLAETFEKRIAAMSEETRELVASGMADLARHLETRDVVLGHLAEKADLIIEREKNGIVRVEGTTLVQIPEAPQPRVSPGWKNVWRENAEYQALALGIGGAAIGALATVALQFMVPR